MENADDEAPKDPGIQQPAHQGYTEKDFEGNLVLFLQLVLIKYYIYLKISDISCQFIC